MKRSHAELTDFPDLYRHCYWGWFRSEPDQQIITARNTFAAEYHLAKWCNARAPQKFMSHEGFDHQEAYWTDTKQIVCLTSPYHRSLPSWASKWFTEIYPVYHLQAISYVAKFDSIQKIRQAISRLLEAHLVSANDGI